MRNPIAVAAVVVLMAAPAAAATITPISEGNPAFAGTTLEDFFPGPDAGEQSSYDYGNGLTHLNLNGELDLVTYFSSYGMGTEPSISEGRDGTGDGYFGTGETPTSFQFAFAGGSNVFGFAGAESSVSGGSAGRNGELNLEFYDLSNSLITSLAISTAGTFAWDQYHGFISDVPLSRVVFRDVGHMVVDDVRFGTAQIPEPTTLLLLGTGAMGLVARSRRRSKRQGQ